LSALGAAPILQVPVNPKRARRTYRRGNSDNRGRFSMTVHKLMVRCYRKTPGDAGCHDMPAFVEDGFEDDMVEQAGFLLLAFHSDPSRPPERKPNNAHLEDEHGHVIARIRIGSWGKIERVAN
jgi:hypothetical protein